MHLLHLANGETAFCVTIATQNTRVLSDVKGCWLLQNYWRFEISWFFNLNAQARDMKINYYDSSKRRNSPEESL